jgi:hypothetical protein
MEGDKFILLWNDFEFNASSSYKKLINDTHFVDVTLVCDDNRQVKAHKVVLSSSSPVLEQILIANPHQHPLIYLHKVKYSCLQSLIKYIYLGQTEVAESELQDFMSIAEELEVEGLKGKFQKAIEHEHDGTIQDISEECTMKNTTSTSALQTDLISTESELEALDQHNEVNLEERLEAKNDENGLQCNKCFKLFSNIRNWQHHAVSKHLGLRFPCDNCEYKGTTKSNLKRHMQRCFERFRNFQERSKERSMKHPPTSVIQSDLISTEIELEALDKNNLTDSEERLEAKQYENRFHCNQCFKQFSNLSQMQQHSTSAHLEISHICDKCEYKGTTKLNLERHIQKVHTQF